jgi:hypothetical protein
MPVMIDTGERPETGQLRTEDRLDALAYALAQCATAGEALTLENDWVRAKWKLRSATYTHAAAAMCEQRRAELSRQAAQARGGASPRIGKEG